MGVSLWCLAFEADDAINGSLPAGLPPEDRIQAAVKPLDPILGDGSGGFGQQAEGMGAAVAIDQQDSRGLYSLLENQIVGQEVARADACLLPGFGEGCERGGERLIEAVQPHMLFQVERNQSVVVADQLG